MYNELIQPYIKIYLDELGKSQMAEIIEYSLKDGKCLRGFIVKHIMNVLSQGKVDLWEPIVAVEIIQATSLILDDLPCMDNDKVRRSKVCTHIKFGECESILTSYYMCSQVAKLLSKTITSLKQTNIKLTKEDISKVNDTYNVISQNFSEKLVLGQLLDLSKDVHKMFNYKIDPDEIDIVTVIYKTSSLFSICFALGGSIGMLYDKEIELGDFEIMGKSFGIMFQIMDDFKDFEQDKDGYNFVRRIGKEKAIEIYNENKDEFKSLLKKNKLYTKEFKKLISFVDTRLKNNYDN